MKKTKIDHYTDKEALDFHRNKKPGKIEIISSKNMTTKRDLALAYSPGVAAPVRMISENPEAAYDYTSKGNLVAVISNGTAILGMGNLGALASKPVMEGKAVLFKRFADIDSIDLEIDCSDSDEIINSIKNFAPSFGGINLEDIAAPDCFIIEQKLKEILDIPVFHDDQHGTAIITTAALINALDISGKSIKEIKIVVNGAGASAQACADLFKNSGVPNENLIMVDRKGVIYKGRAEGMDQWKSRHAIETKLRTLEEAIKDIEQQGEGPITVNLNASDHQQFTAHLSTDLDHLSLRIDSSLSPGSVRITMDDSAVEDLIETRLSALSEKLLGLPEHRSAPRSVAKAYAAERPDLTETSATIIEGNAEELNLSGDTVESDIPDA